MSDAAAKTDELYAGPLYAKLVEVLPVYASHPFDAPRDQPRDPHKRGDLNVMKLSAAAELSYEAVYKWLRKSRITPRNAKRLLMIANRPDNLAALQALGRPAPTIEDFTPFVFA